MTTKEFIDSLTQTFAKCLEISKSKNMDYAGQDDPFRNFKNAEVVGVSIERGIMVRVMDKISRISNLLDKPADVSSEKIEDTIIDAINYLNILKARLESKK